MATPKLNDLVHQTENQIQTDTETKFVDVNTIVTILVFQGLKMLLPEIREWVKLSFSKIVLKRLEIENRLKDYALEKELDFKTAQEASEKIAQNINEDNIKQIVAELENS